MSHCQQNQTDALRPDGDVEKTEEQRNYLQPIFTILRHTVQLLTLPIIAIISFVSNLFTQQQKSLEGRVVLITGSAMGLGRQLAREFAKNGCKLACVDFNEAENANIVQELNQQYPNQAKAYKANVAKIEQIASMAKDVEDDWKHVDILVNNAGIIPAPGIITELTDREIDVVIEVNLLSHFRMVRQFLPGMMERNDGHIVAISSVSGFEGLAKCAPYAASKSGLNGFMSTLKEELKLIPNNRIQTTTICPYFISTHPIYSQHWNARLPELSVQYSAEEIVQAVKENKTLITIPRYLYWVLHIMKLMPEKIHHSFRNYYYTKLNEVSDSVKQSMPSWLILQDTVKNK